MLTLCPPGMLQEKSHLKCPIGQTLAKSNEKWTSNLRTDSWCSFSNLMSTCGALNCTDATRLTLCPARALFSPSCPLFPPPHLTVVGFCAVLDRTRWHVSQFRHRDDQIPSGGSFRAVPQQHSIFDLPVAPGVRYRKGPVRCPLGMLIPT